MAIGSQCGEDAIFEKFFKNKPKGLVVDVGAADGCDNSNSWKLIQSGWSGILIEPEPAQYGLLSERYKDNPNVATINMAVGTKTGVYPFYCSHQVSTLDEDWRDRCVAAYGVEYKTIEIRLFKLDFILNSLNCPTKFDLLTIDCEARDVDVLDSLSLVKYRPTLICMECPGGEVPGYSVLTKTPGNTIFLRDSCS